jgi:hypothetical protein
LKVESLLGLQLTDEATKDPLVQGMVESLINQLKRASDLQANNRLDDENAAKLDPSAIVISGKTKFVGPLNAFELVSSDWM